MLHPIRNVNDKSILQGQPVGQPVSQPVSQESDGMCGPMATATAESQSGQTFHENAIRTRLAGSTYLLAKAVCCFCSTDCFSYISSFSSFLLPSPSSPPQYTRESSNEQESMSSRRSRPRRRPRRSRERASQKAIARETSHV